MLVKFDSRCRRGLIYYKFHLLLMNKPVAFLCGLLVY